MRLSAVISHNDDDPRKEAPPVAAPFQQVPQEDLLTAAFSSLTLAVPAIDSSHEQVFVDSSGRRLRRLRRVATVAATSCAVYLGVLAVSLGAGILDPSVPLPLVHRVAPLVGQAVTSSLGVGSGTTATPKPGSAAVPPVNHRSAAVPAPITRAPHTDLSSVRAALLASASLRPILAHPAPATPGAPNSTGPSLVSGPAGPATTSPATQGHTGPGNRNTNPGPQTADHRPDAVVAVVAALRTVQ